MNVIATVSVAQAAVIFVRDLLLAGGNYRRSVRVADWEDEASCVGDCSAGFVFALGPGHNVPFLGNQPATGKGIILLIAIVLAASIVLVEGHAALMRRSA